MQVLEVKEVRQWDGADRHNFGFFISKDVPDEAIKKDYQYCMISPRTLLIYDSLQDVKDNTEAALRRRAWEKLSPAERRALNLSEPPKCPG